MIFSYFYFSSTYLVFFLNNLCFIWRKLCFHCVCVSLKQNYKKKIFSKQTTMIIIKLIYSSILALCWFQWNKLLALKLYSIGHMYICNEVQIIFKFNVFSTHKINSKAFHIIKYRNIINMIIMIIIIIT